MSLHRPEQIGDLVIRYEAVNERFTGTVTNTTSSTVAAVRVEIHLSNGEELGPTPRKDLGAGESMPVTLDASGQNFDWWSVHAESRLLARTPGECPGQVVTGVRQSSVVTPAPARPSDSRRRAC